MFYLILDNVHHARARYALCFPFSPGDAIWQRAEAAVCLGPLLIAMLRGRVYPNPIATLTFTFLELRPVMLERYVNLYFKIFFCFLLFGLTCVVVIGSL